MSSDLANDLRSIFAEHESINHGRLSVGIDLESVAEFVHMLTTASGLALLATRFTSLERAYIANDPGRMAARWAAKEAVVKAIGTGFRGIRPVDVQIGREANGRPIVQRGSNRLWPYGAHEWEWSVSMTEDAGAAIAIAVGTHPGEDHGR